MNVEEIMTKEVFTVFPETSVEEVARLISQRGVSGLPVVDKENNLKGIVTEGDLLYRVKNLPIPVHFQLLGGIIYLDKVTQLENDLKKKIALRAEELMTKDVITVRKDTSLEEASTKMVEKRLKRLPVVEDGKLVGVISRKDIVKWFVENS